LKRVRITVFSSIVFPTRLKVLAKVSSGDLDNDIETMILLALERGATGVVAEGVTSVDLDDHLTGSAVHAFSSSSSEVVCSGEEDADAGGEEKGRG
jgi:hypothetical protein